MIISEINPIGKFDTWDEIRLKEIRKEKFNTTIGELLYENNEFILWEINLKPFERLPFRLHKNNYSCTCFSDGLALSRNANGRIILIRLEKGQQFYKECANNIIISDFENVGENDIKIAIIEEKLEPVKLVSNK